MDMAEADSNRAVDKPPPHDTGAQVTSASAEPSARLGVGHRGRRINLVRLAEAQRAVLWCVLAILLLQLSCFGGGMLTVANRFGRGLGPGFPLWSSVLLIASVAGAFFAWRMMRAWGYGIILAFVAAGISVTMGIPGLGVVGAVVLAIVDGRVVRELRRAGCVVGLMGVSQRELNKLRLGVCHNCGYDLRQIAARKCPECGAARAGGPG